jgi:hypothetical protein
MIKVDGDRPRGRDTILLFDGAAHSQTRLSSNVADLVGASRYREFRLHIVEAGAAPDRLFTARQETLDRLRMFAISREDR